MDIYQLLPSLRSVIMFRKYLLPILLAICIIAAAITTSYTVAYYTDASESITNTFKVGSWGE